MECAKDLCLLEKAHVLEVKAEELANTLNVIEGRLFGFKNNPNETCAPSDSSVDATLGRINVTLICMQDVATSISNRLGSSPMEAPKAIKAVPAAGYTGRL